MTVDLTPLPALSLFGFYESQQGIHYLRNACVRDRSRSEKEAWQAARERLGPPVADAGHPVCEPMDADDELYIDELRDRATLKHRFLPGELVGANFTWIEPTRIIAFQQHVLDKRSDRNIPGDIDVNDRRRLLEVCLPHEFPAVQYDKIELPGGGGVKVESDDLNFRFLADGGRLVEGFDDQSQQFVFGPGVGVGSPLVQAVRFDGRIYLRNGYHRVARLAQLGAERVPCMMFEVLDFSGVGAKPDYFFSRTILEGSNVPTIGHFTRERATAVQLRAVGTRLIVQWRSEVIR